MEATGKYDFSATAEDELSFRMGDILKILGTNDNWYKAEFHGHEGFVPQNYVDRHSPSWFHENASRSQAEEMLISRELGAFLIRCSQSSPGDFSISVRHECDVQHFKVMKDHRGHYFLWAEKFTSLNKLVEYYKSSSISPQRQIFLQDGSRDDMAPPMSMAPPPQGKRGSLPEERTHPHGGFGGPPNAGAHCGASDQPTVMQGKRGSLPEERTHPHGGIGGPPNAGAHRRASDQPPATQGKRGSLPEERTHPHGGFGGPPNAGAHRRASDQPPATQGPAMQVRAMFDFTAEEGDELGFNIGEVIEVLDHSDSSWWKGRLRGRIGLFPANYTTPI